MLRGVSLPALAMTLAIGAAGGLLARAAQLPLALLMGSLVVVAGISIAGWKPFGLPVTLPPKFRSAFVPVIGVAIGGAFTPQVIGQLLTWWPSLLALCVYLPLAHAVGFLIYRWGGLPRAEAFFGAVPGGLIESVQLGREAGADEALLTVLQFLRLIVTIIAVPLGYWALTGQAVGSASGARLGVGPPLGVTDVAVLVVAGALGWWVARQLRFPGAQITGPILFSAIAHATGLVQGVPPVWLVGVTQVVLGTGLGARFLGASRAMLRRAAGLALVNTLASMAIAAAFAYGLHQLVDEPLTAVFLAFAPGGLAEMSLIALSLQMSVVFVTVHHVARIILAVTFAKLGSRVLRV